MLKPFSYLRDRLFLICVGIYFLNRMLESVQWSHTYLRWYLNDLLLVPIFVPIMLWCMRKLKLRKHDLAPSLLEIGMLVLVIGLVFEGISPYLPVLKDVSTPDINDLICYALGGVMSLGYWCWVTGEYTSQTIETE
ncbi:MAG TPA: hypothetical protein DCM28_10410 [Phycisphaerales bacterium]|nr:hypothetical protein [Phycisphaerales bacterium]